MAIFTTRKATRNASASCLGFAAIAVLAAFGILFGRFVYLQILQHDYYRTRAEDNRIALIPIVPNRGVITDRNGVVLPATTRLSPSKSRLPGSATWRRRSTSWARSSTSSPRTANASSASRRSQEF